MGNFTGRKQQKSRRINGSFFCLSLLGRGDLTAIVGHAVLAHTVGQGDGPALGAGVVTGSLQLPHGAAALVPALLGYFTLRDGHFDTSLFGQCPRT